MQKLLILGAGQYGMVTRETAEATGAFEMISFLDDHNPLAIGPLDAYHSFAQSYDSAVVAIGNPTLRLQWLEKLAHAGFQIPILIHPKAYVSPSARLEGGTLVEPMAVVQAGAVVERGGLLCAGSVVNHNSFLAEGCHVDCNAVVPANSRVPAGTKVPCGSVFQNQS